MLVAVEWVAGIVLVAIVVWFAIRLVRTTVRDLSEGPFPSGRRAALMALALMGVLVPVRHLLVPISFSHSNYFGPQLLDAVLGYGGLRIREYGPLGFLFYRVPATLGRDPLEALALTNGLLSALASFALSAALALGTRRPAVLPWGMALSLLHPMVARLSLSEDAILLNLFLCFFAFHQTVRFLMRQDRTSGMLALSAAILALWTRQIGFPWLLATFLVLPLVTRKASRCMALALSGTFLLLLAVRVFEDLGTDDRVSYELLAGFLKAPSWCLAALVRHPLVDPAAAAVLLPLLVVGVAAIRRSPVAGLFLAAFLVAFLATAVAGLDNIGDGIGFRSPALFAGIALGGAGLDAFMRWMPRGTWGRSGLRWLLSMGALANGLILPASEWAFRVSPETREYRYLEAVIPFLGDFYALRTFRSWRYSPDLVPPQHLFRRSGREVEVLDIREATGHRRNLVLLGLYCDVRSVAELYYQSQCACGLLPRDEDPDAMAVQQRLPLDEFLAESAQGRLPIGIERPTDERAICKLIRRFGHPVSPSWVLPPGPDDVPFGVWTGKDVTLEIVEIDDEDLAMLRSVCMEQ
ncbi:MAG TPA: hypothetical protein PLQ97_05850 [Myxococcota bacterium]|nr:hypothetical protein [Myxococcota bacterium]HQK50187.1 hypothetical protein [Myxococcota bacterium]